MKSKTSTLHPRLRAYVDDLTGEYGLIPAERRELLARLADYIVRRRRAGRPVRLHFICTHNSRRSHISQLWATVAAAWFDLDGIATFSGGTEATAFNPRGVAALQRAGFQIDHPGGDNPRYRVSFSDDAPPVLSYSKTFDDPVNPREGFAAVMTCAEADAGCPVVPGAEFRLALTYDDPKEADGTPEEAARYDERVRQIGRELFYALHLVGQLQNQHTHE